MAKIEELNPNAPVRSQRSFVVTTTAPNNTAAAALDNLNLPKTSKRGDALVTALHVRRKEVNGDVIMYGVEVEYEQARPASG